MAGVTTLVSGLEENKLPTRDQKSLGLPLVSPGTVGEKKKTKLFLVDPEQMCPGGDTGTRTA